LNRTDFQRLADLRIGDGEALFSARRYAGAYYIAGYAVESALKACIAKKVRKHDFPDRKTVNDSYQHDLVKLLDVTELKIKLDEKRKSDGTFNANWAVVKDWSSQMRYERKISRKTARDFCPLSLTPGTEYCDGYRRSGKQRH